MHSGIYIVYRCNITVKYGFQKLKTHVFTKPELSGLIILTILYYEQLIYESVQMKNAG